MTLLSCSKIALWLCVATFALHAGGCVHVPITPPKSVLPPGRVGVVGEVVREGLYDFHPDMSILEALRMAGGITALADPHRATLTRMSGGLAATVNIHLDAIADGREMDVPLEDGDVVSVPAQRTDQPAWESVPSESN